MDFQGQVFNWAAGQGEANSFVLLMIGVCFLFQGYRFSRALIALSCVLFGFCAGGVLGDGFGYAPAFSGLMLGLTLGVAALIWVSAGVMTSAVCTGAVLGAYLTYQTGLTPFFIMLGCAVGGSLGMAAAWLHPRTIPMVLTVVQGAAVLIVGFVGMASAVLPGMGATFVSWSSSWAFLVPAMMTMLCVTGIAFQANARQGDIETGAGTA